MLSLFIPYDVLSLIGHERTDAQEANRSYMIYRTIKPLLVDAIQIKEPEEIRTESGILHVKSGDWLIRDAQGNLTRCKDINFKCSYEAVDGCNDLEHQSEGMTCGC